MHARQIDVVQAAPCRESALLPHRTSASASHVPPLSVSWPDLGDNDEDRPLRTGHGVATNPLSASSLSPILVLLFELQLWRSVALVKEAVKDPARLRQFLSSRRLVAEPTVLLSCVTVGCIAASRDVLLPDYLLTVGMVLGAVASMVRFKRFKRAYAARRLAP